jgi:hypothetical protein
LSESGYPGLKDLQDFTLKYDVLNIDLINRLLESDKLVDKDREKLDQKSLTD